MPDCDGSDGSDEGDEGDESDESDESDEEWDSELFVKKSDSLRSRRKKTWFGHMQTGLEVLLIRWGGSSFEFTLVVKLKHAEQWMEDGDIMGDMNKHWTSADKSRSTSAKEKKKRWEKLSGIRLEEFPYKVEVAEWALWGKANWEANGAGSTTED